VHALTENTLVIDDLEEGNDTQMNRIHLAAVLLSMAVTTVMMSPAHAQQNCDLYGKIAVKQSVEAHKANCGFTGPRWSKDLKAHTNWCGTVGPTQWRSELKKREKELKKCTG